MSGATGRTVQIRLTPQELKALAELADIGRRTLPLAPEPGSLRWRDAAMGALGVLRDKLRNEPGSRR